MKVYGNTFPITSILSLLVFLRYSFDKEPVYVCFVESDNWRNNISHCAFYMISGYLSNSYKSFTNTIMAKIPDGILGKFIGRAGGVSGYMRNGQNIIRTSTSNTKDKSTPKRIAQREKIKVCNEFTKPFSGTGFFNKTFPSYGDSGTGYNRATSALMNLAVVGSYPHISISYPQVLISRGALPEAENATASLNAQDNLFFSWTDNSGTGTAKANDKVILVAYFPGLKQIIYTLNAALRADCQAVLITNTMQNHIAETWIGFLSHDEKDAANSVYAGGISL